MKTDGWSASSATEGVALIRGIGGWMDGRNPKQILSSGTRWRLAPEADNVSPQDQLMNRRLGGYHTK